LTNSLNGGLKIQGKISAISFLSDSDIRIPLRRSPLRMPESKGRGDLWAPRCSRDHDHRLWRCRNRAVEGGGWRLLTKPIDFALLREEIDIRLQQAG
jgi:hypothetical protein